MHVINNRFVQLEDWYQTPLGVITAKAIKNHLIPYLQKAHGHYLLQLGIGEQQEWLQTCRIPQKYIVNIEAQQQKGALKCQYEALPIANDSVDVVFLPHTLEFVNKPELLLEEVRRILVPNGLILVVGFNPLSAWGLRHSLKLGKWQAPWNGRFLTSYKQQRFLIKHHFTVLASECFCHYLPFSQLQWLQKTRFLELLGELFGLYPGGIYLYVAQKQVLELLPADPAWQFDEYTLRA